MGSCCSCCRPGAKDYEEIKGSAKAEGETTGGGQGGGGSGGQGEGGGGGGGDVKSQKSDLVGAWEAEFLESKTSSLSFVTHSAIFSFPSGKLMAARPSGFTPSPTGVNDLVNALQGDSSGLEERSVALGGQTPVCTPGKIDPGKAILCSSSSSAGEGGEGGGGGVGCIAVKTKESLLVVFYNGNPDTAFNLTSDMAGFMEASGR